jgi:hypothetical protein
MRLNSPLRPGCDVSAVLHVVRRPESFCCGIVALLNSAVERVQDELSRR